jgi:hypothetical protein
VRLEQFAKHALELGSFVGSDLAMANPWDPFPFPLAGDTDPYDTFSGVGLVMSEWESIEFNLARLYSVFVGQGSRGNAIQDYGKGKIFRERRIGLQAVARAYFMKRCDQQLEGEFDLVCTTADGFADRRNEVAHGIVMEVSRIAFFQDKLTLADLSQKQHLVVPPYHTVRNHWAGLPQYAYNAGQLQALAGRFLDFGKRIVSFRDGL